MEPDLMILVFWKLSFKPDFSLSSFTFIKSLFSFSLHYAIIVFLPGSSACLRLMIFRNSKNLRYANDTTLMAEDKEELKSILMKEKEESEKAGLKLWLTGKHTHTHTHAHTHTQNPDTGTFREKSGKESAC